MGHRGSFFDLCHRVFCLFSSKGFIVSGFTFRPLIHFEFIFVYGVRRASLVAKLVKNPFAMKETPVQFLGQEESDMTEGLHFPFHALEKEMATHSSVLAWRISGTGELGGLPSMGLHRVRHD